MPLLKLSDVVVDGVKFTVTTALNGNLHIMSLKKKKMLIEEYSPSFYGCSEWQKTVCGGH